MKKISKVATASVLLFTLANPLAVFAENKVGNVSETSSNKTTQDLTITSEEVNGDIVFHVTAQRDTYEAIVYAKINEKDYTYNLGNLKKGQVSKIVQPDVSINNNNASISKESNKGKILPNTSAVRELVQKTVLYNNEINGNVIEAKVVYKVYELVEKNSTQKNEKPETSEPKAEEPAASAPKVEKPVVSIPKVEEPAASAPKAEEPMPSVPKAEKPATPAPKAEKPVTPVPKAEKPVVSAPKAEEPASPAPKAEEPTPSVPKAEKPATPTPKVEEPASPAPKAEEPVAPAPKVEKPAASTPKAEEPVTPAPKEGAPATLAPKAEKPVTPAPKAEEPTLSVPKAEKPATPAPKAEKPVTPVPKAEKPVAPAPKAEEPMAPAPKAEKPVAPAPKAEEPATPAPKSEEPATPAPKAEEPTAPAPKTEEPMTPAPKAEEPASPAPKAEEPTTPTLKAEEPTTPTPKAEEPTTPTPKAEEPSAPAPKVEEPVTPAPKEEEPATSAPKAEEPVAPAPKAEEPTTPTPKAEGPSAPAPKAEEPTTSTPKAEEPAAPAPKAEEPVAPAPKAEEPAAPAPKAEEPAAPAAKAEEPAAPAPKVEEPAAPAPKAEEPAPKAEEPAATPKEDTPSEEVVPKDEKLEEAKKDGKDVIEKIAASKLSEIEKVKDEAEKAKLEAKLKELKEAGLEAINNAKNHDAAVDAADEYQTKIDEINVPGEELPAPNYNKDNLTNGRNEGTTIDNGSTAIGHGSGEATSTTPTQPATEERPTSPATPTQPASTSEGTSSFRNAPQVQVRARRVARAANQPEGTVNISYNYDGMPDINGFLSDPGENNTVAISNSATEDEVKELVKAKIQAKAQELAKHGYKVKEEIVFEQDTNVKNFNYVVTFTKEKTGTTGFRIAPEVQVRAKKVVKRDLSNKTKQINIYYNLTNLKDIAGALGEVGENNMLTLSGNATKEEIKKAIEEKTKSQIEKLNKQGFKVTSTTDLDQIVEGGDSYDYVVEFTKESKSTSVNNTGFRKAPLVQKRAKRSAEVQETVDVNIYFNLKTLPGIAGALDVDGDTTIKLPKNATEAQVKAVIQEKITKVEKRGYKVSDFYFGAKMEHGYDFVVEFKK